MPGDSHASDAWIQAALAEHECRLTRYALRLTGELEMARDAVQETFLRLCHYQPAELEGHLLPWLFRVCRQRSFDLRRKERRMTRIEQDESIEFISTEPSPLSLLETREQTSRLVERLGALGENEQEVLRLKFQEGFTYRQIGEITGRTTSHVGVIIHKAIQRLRTELAAEAALARCDETETGPCTANTKTTS